MFEDIDAIFGKDREKLLTDSVLTFSGMEGILGQSVLYRPNCWRSLTSPQFGSSNKSADRL